MPPCELIDNISLLSKALREYGLNFHVQYSRDTPWVRVGDTYGGTRRAVSDMLRNRRCRLVLDMTEHHRVRFDTDTGSALVWP